jgi:hypothetical protein
MMFNFYTNSSKIMKTFITLGWYILCNTMGGLLSNEYNVILGTFWERLILTIAITLFFELTIFALFRIILPWGLFNIFED